ncbi:hypothetical protein TYRP_009993 [Tyrophagus putrescentiae]|nr:hypothetical protein TYRP_009993 [Tyrophagus putrescentiae]
MRRESVEEEGGGDDDDPKEMMSSLSSWSRSRSVSSRKTIGSNNSNNSKSTLPLAKHRFLI